jgi:two-component system, LytTR family, response regulator
MISDSKPVKTIIVDDEDLARALLREYLAEIPDCEVVAECANGFDAVKAITELEPDLVFLDIQMPKLSGFEVLELLDRAPVIIFATAFDEYALKAFDVHAADYLLKPYSKERFAEAVQHAREFLHRTSPPDYKPLVADARPAGIPVDRILVREGAKVHVIPVATIDYVEAQDDYYLVHAAGKKMLKQGTLSALEKELNPRQFLRIHRSYILNIDRIARIEPYAKDSRVAVLKDGTRLQVSRAGYARLRETLHL